jgi:hypothetical protein
MPAPQSLRDDEKTESDADEETGDAQHWKSRAWGNESDKPGKSRVTYAERNHNDSRHERPFPARQRSLARCGSIWAHDTFDQLGIQCGTPLHCVTHEVEFRLLAPLVRDDQCNKHAGNGEEGCRDSNRIPDGDGVHLYRSKVRCAASATDAIRSALGLRAISAFPAGTELRPIHVDDQ